MNSTWDAAEEYASRGWATIPVQGKRATVEWAQYQERMPTPEERRDWFSNNGCGLAIVTGPVSGDLVAVDCDSPEAVEQVEELLPDGLVTPIAKTPRGRHYLFRATGIRNAAGIMPGVDVRGEGGYVVAPPGDGREWIISPEDCQPAEMPQALADLCQQPGESVSSRQQMSADSQQNVSNGYGGAALADELAKLGMAQVGTRNHTLNRAAFKLGQLIPGGYIDESSVQAALLAMAVGIGLPDAEARASIRSGLYAGQREPRQPMAGSYKNSISLESDRVADTPSKPRYSPSPVNNEQKPLMEQIREWVLLTPGAFVVTDADKELGLLTRADKNNRAKCLERLCGEGLIERYGDKRGWYRRVERDLTTLDWLDADCSKVYDLQWAFGLEQLADIYPKNIIVIAGEPNAGKTAFCLDFVRRNMARHEIHYFSSEMGPEELKLRIGKFGLPLDQWNFQAYERAGTFRDVIKPDAINVIDYLEQSDKFYQVAERMKAIHDRLKKGICLIALQKKRGADAGRGDSFSLEKPRLYLNLEPNLLTIKKAKNWHQQGRNPNGMEFPHKLIDGCRFSEV